MIMRKLVTALMARPLPPIPTIPSMQTFQSRKMTEANYRFRGPWPNPHIDQSNAEIADGPGGQPIVAHTGDNK